MPDSTSVEDCYRIAEEYELIKQLPTSTRELFERHALEETPKSDDPMFHKSRWWTILSNQSAIEAASVAAERAGFIVHIDNSCDDWDYSRAADYLLSKVRELRKQFSPVCLLSGAGVLLADEPTNHLDLMSTQVMERALVHFPGAVIVVSHDRFFLDKVANRLLVFEGDGHLRHIEGTWTTWDSQRRR